MDFDDEQQLEKKLTNKRVVQPYVSIIKLIEYVKFLEPCQCNQVAFGANKEFYELVVHCKIENLPFRVPNWKYFLHVRLASANEDDGEAGVSEKSTAEFVDNFDAPSSTIDLAHTLKCFDANRRCYSKLLLETLPTVKKGFLYEIDDKTMECHVDNLYVLKKDLTEIEEQLEQISTHYDFPAPTIDNFLENMNTFSTQRNKMIENARKILRFNSSMCRLKLQVIIFNLETKRLENYLTAPVYSNIIHDILDINSLKDSTLRQPSDESTATSASAHTTDQHYQHPVSAPGREIYVSSLNDMKNLRILRSSRIYGNTKGGEEMILLTSKIDPSDVQVEFFQFKNDTELSWRAWGILNRADIHGNCSLVIKTPPFKPLPVSTTQPTTTSTDGDPKKDAAAAKTTAPTKSSTITRNKVYFRLYRPSTGDYSDKWVFYYCDDWNEFRFLLGDDFYHNSRLSKKPNKKLINKNTNNSTKNENLSSGVKRKNPENQSSNETEEEMILEEEKTTAEKTGEAASGKSSKKKVLKTTDEDKESDEYQVRMLEELMLDTPKSSSGGGNEDDEMSDDTLDDSTVGKTSISSQSAAATKPKSIESKDQETQTMLEELNKMESKKNFTPSDYYQLKNNYDMCLNKMNALAERSSKSLLKLARTRSMHEFLKTQRFLLTTQDEEGNTPIHLSIMYGNFDLTAIFTEVSLTISFQNIINIRNFMQLTPLMVACYLNEIEVSEYLLEANADISISDCYGFNPIHVACKNNNLELLKVLIKHVNRNNNYSVLNALSHDGYAPIHLAVLNENLDILRELLYNGKNLKINIPDKRAGYTALHHAASRQCLLQFCKLLVKNEDIDIDCRSYTGCTPLHIAVANKNYLITMLLLNYGANLNVKSDVPVHYDIDFYQKIARKNTLLRNCLEKLAEKNEIKSEISLNSTENKIHETIEDSTKANTEPKNANTVKFDIDFTKVSKEINKSINVEMDKDKMDEDQRARTQQHNLDALFYAQNDSWVSLVIYIYIFF